MKGAKTEPPTLCWGCQRATNSPGLGCPWSKIDGTPVDGWKAVKTIVRNPQRERRDTESYAVTECPLFLWDEKEQPLNFFRWKITQNGREYTILQMAEKEGVSATTIYNRVKRGDYETFRVLRNSWRV